jgi:transcriptional regulator with XRE-family HTH domain
VATTRTTHPKEVWIRLTNRKMLAKLMAIQGVSQRELATAAGWKAHSYLGRLLRGDVDTLDVDPAVRIAEYLQVGVDDLFVARSSNTSRPHGKRIAA